MPEVGFPVFLKESLLLLYSANYGHVTIVNLNRSIIQRAARASDVVRENACCALIGMYFWTAVNLLKYQTNPMLS